MPRSARDMIVQSILPHIPTATPVLLIEVVQVKNHAVSVVLSRLSKNCVRLLVDIVHRGFSKDSTYLLKSQIGIDAPLRDLQTTLIPCVREESKR
jgi:hypothetical protein